MKRDWPGIILLGLGIFFLFLTLILGDSYGWITPNKRLAFGALMWPVAKVSIVFFAFWASILFFALFATREILNVREGKTPIVKEDASVKRDGDDPVDIKFRQ